VPLRPQVTATQATATSHHDTRYQAGTWPATRRVIMKAEIVWHHGREACDNPRFVITNLCQTPEWIEHPRLLRARRQRESAEGIASRTRLRPNHLRALLGQPTSRLTLTAAADMLLQELQLREDHTALARAQVARLRQALLTIGVHVVPSVPPDRLALSAIASGSGHVASSGPRLGLRSSLTADVSGGSGFAHRRCPCRSAWVHCDGPPPPQPGPYLWPDDQIVALRRLEALMLDATHSLVNNAD
jgi:hypothetical protein